MTYVRYDFTPEGRPIITIAAPSVALVIELLLRETTRDVSWDWA